MLFVCRPSLARLAWGSGDFDPAVSAPWSLSITAGGAGLTPDIVAGLVGQRLSERLGQQVVVENRPGAGSNIGTELVVRASPDGYTLLLATGSNAVSATLYEKLNFNFIRD